MLALGDAHGCALVGGDVSCWAPGEDAALVVTGASALASHGQRTCTIIAGEVACWGVGEPPAAVPGLAELGPMARVALSAEAACAVHVDREALVCWGADTRGELAGSVGEVGVPRRVPLAQQLPIDRLAAGAFHFVGLRAAGQDIVAWGDNAAGQILGTSSDPIRGVGSPLSLRTRPPRPVVDVAAGAAHSCALALSGRVDCWGAAYPDGVHTKVEGATRVAAYGASTCAVLADQTIVCWDGDAEPARVSLEVGP